MISPQGLTDQSIVAQVLDLAALAVPAADSAADIVMRDVIGNKLDTVAGNSLYSRVLGISRIIEKAACPIINGSTVLFTVAGGPIIIEELVGVCDTGVGGAANGHLDATTVAPVATTPFSTDVAITALVIGSTVTFTTAATPVLVPTVNGALPSIPAARWLMTPGTILFHTSAAQNGNIKWHCRYKPLSGLTVVT